MAITARALLLCCLMVTLPLTGCITTEAPTPQLVIEENESFEDPEEDEEANGEGGGAVVRGRRSSAPAVRRGCYFFDQL